MQAERVSPEPSSFLSVPAQKGTCFGAFSPTSQSSSVIHRQSVAEVTDFSLGSEDSGISTWKRWDNERNKLTGRSARICLFISAREPVETHCLRDHPVWRIVCIFCRTLPLHTYILPIYKRAVSPIGAPTNLSGCDHDKKKVGEKYPRYEDAQRRTQQPRARIYLAQNCCSTLRTYHQANVTLHRYRRRLFGGRQTPATPTRRSTFLRQINNGRRPSSASHRLLAFSVVRDTQQTQDCSP